MTIHFLRAGREVFAGRGHLNTVFVRKGDLLVYADYDLVDCGCTLIAIDLTTGEEVWRNQLLAVGLVGHSRYSNKVRLELGDDVVRVWGDESAGRYVEVVDLAGGETFAHRIFQPRP
jgi:hypothetical protein